MIYFTADPHRGHGNIMKYCGRIDFMTDEDRNNYLALVKIKDRDALKALRLSPESIQRHDDGLDQRHNSRVKDDDTWICVGDFCFRNSPGGKPGEGESRTAEDYLAKLNGHDVLIQGNHDNNNSAKTRIKSLQIDIGGRLINCVHNPMDASFDHEINFTGHVHNNWKFLRRFEMDEHGRETGRYTDCVNVGVDVWRYMPVHINEILPAYHRWKNGGCK